MLKTNKILKILPLIALLLRSKYISDVTFPNFLGNAPSMILFEMSISSKEEDMLKMVEGKGPLNLFDPIYKYCKLLRRPISSGITPARNDQENKILPDVEAYKKACRTAHTDHQKSCR